MTRPDFNAPKNSELTRSLHFLENYLSYFTSPPFQSELDYYVFEKRLYSGISTYVLRLICNYIASLTIASDKYSFKFCVLQLFKDIRKLNLALTLDESIADAKIKCRLVVEYIEFKKLVVFDYRSSINSDSIKIDYFLGRIVSIVSQKDTLSDSQISCTLNGLSLLTTILSIQDPYLRDRVNAVAVNLFNFEWSNKEQLVVDAVHFYEGKDYFHCYNLLLQPIVHEMFDDSLLTSLISSLYCSPESLDSSKVSS
jgi:hypothetical protein